MSDRIPPAPENRYRDDHAQLLSDSYYAVTGRKLIDCAREALGETLYFAPFALVSHDTAEDPVFNYANKMALDLFEMSWEQFTSLPSRKSAEQPLREERARLLAAVNAQGFIDNYTGIRIASTGRRFFIEHATVWNLAIDGTALGQAAMFRSWRPVTE
ncbi:MAG: MEKHLA domain-containing protein [Sedimenticola sp.]|nr:MEKHLA domain-containing protein [Sedimenticola sp.]